jgi:hypothetical protein
VFTVLLAEVTSGVGKKTLPATVVFEGDRKNYWKVGGQTFFIQKERLLRSKDPNKDPEAARWIYPEKSSSAALDL